MGLHIHHHSAPHTLHRHLIRGPNVDALIDPFLKASQHHIASILGIGQWPQFPAGPLHPGEIKILRLDGLDRRQQGTVILLQVLPGQPVPIPGVAEGQGVGDAILLPQHQCLLSGLESGAVLRPKPHEIPPAKAVGRLVIEPPKIGRLVHHIFAVQLFRQVQEEIPLIVPITHRPGDQLRSQEGHLLPVEAIRHPAQPQKLHPVPQRLINEKSHQRAVLCPDRIAQKGGPVHKPGIEQLLLTHIGRVVHLIGNGLHPLQAPPFNVPLVKPLLPAAVGQRIGKIYCPPVLADIAPPQYPPALRLVRRKPLPLVPIVEVGGIRGMVEQKSPLRVIVVQSGHHRLNGDFHLLLAQKDKLLRRDGAHGPLHLFIVLPEPLCPRGRGVRFYAV